jgi:hypothetical protein
LPLDHALIEGIKTEAELDLVMEFKALNESNNDDNLSVNLDADFKSSEEADNNDHLLVMHSPESTGILSVGIDGMVNNGEQNNESTPIPQNDEHACADKKKHDPNLEMHLKIKVLSQFSRAKPLAMAEPIIDQPLFDGIDLLDVSNEFGQAKVLKGEVVKAAKVVAEGEEAMMEKFEADLTMSSWERDNLIDKELFIQVENSLLDFAADLSICDKHVVMWNLEDDDPSE